MRQDPARIVLVTGASRGVAAKVARRLADADTHVLVHYRRNVAAAEAVAAAIREAGGNASTLAADISDAAATAAMMDSIEARFGRLDAMILDASGGLGAGANVSYAVGGDREAHRRLARLAMPLMPAGGRIVFATSHQAHFFPNKAVPKGYAAVAAGIRAGETALSAMRLDFARAAIQFTVVSANLGGPLPAVDDMAAAIVRSVNTTNPSGVVYVGSANYLMTA
ncbi:SDR family oxidoreductase [Mycobacterium sp. WMMD1722]|uniref:SDR family oxidoreductase n=1 Tax=Mycobacterium sp. WMMD1722 TaxID=3404117 RepID=UPI003BF54DD5